MKSIGILAGLAAASIWGGMYVVSKVVLEIIPPFALLSLRLAIGAAGLGAFVAMRKRRMPALSAGGRLLLIGMLGYGVSLGLQFVGTKLSTAANASLVTSASPAFIVLFAALILRERLTIRKAAALALATLGVLAVIDLRSAQLDASTFRGNLALFGAAATWALYSVLIRRVRFETDTLTVSLFALLGGLFISLPAAAIEGAAGGIAEVSPGIVAGVLYLGVVSTAVAIYLWNQSLATLEASVVSLLFFAQPVVGAALGAALLGEPLTRGFWVGGALIGAGLLLASFSRAAESPTARQAAETLDQAI